MSTTKTIAEWEELTGVILSGAQKLDLTKSVTEQEFKTLLGEYGYVGVDHKQRADFLKQNGYEVTRANMTDSSLSAK